MYFRNPGLQETWLDRCLKSIVSEDPLTGKVVNGSKHCFNQDNSIFTIFIDHCEGN